MASRTGELFINGVDAFATWGIFFESSSLSALLTPAPLKEYVENNSAGYSGVRAVTATDARPKIDKRGFSLTFCLSATGMADFLTKYAAFCAQMYAGYFTLSVRYLPNMTFNLRYVSCSQFTEYNGRLARFVLKVEETNPTNR